jgi:hypothetical protein
MAQMQLFLWIGATALAAVQGCAAAALAHPMGAEDR